MNEGTRERFRASASVPTWAAWWGTVTIGLSAVGCGGSTVKPPPFDLDDYAQNVAAAACELLGGCCEVNGLASERTSCERTFERFLRTEFASEPQTVYDSTAAATCLSEIASLPRDCSRDLPSVAACSRVRLGTLAEGDRCTDFGQCAEPLGVQVRCASPAAGGEFVCAWEEQSARARLGDTCSRSCGNFWPGDSRILALTDSFHVDFCRGADPACYRSDGLYCASDGRCASLVGVGAACEKEACFDGAYCADSMPRRCMAQKPDGAPAADARECLSGAIENGACQTLLKFAACAW